MEIADASATKVFSSEQLQVIGQSLADVVGRHADPDPGTAALMTWLDVQLKRNIVLTFGGGVNEIQRELIATAGLACRGPGDEHSEMSTAMTPENPVTPQTAIRAAADSLAAAGESRPRTARDPVNLPMIRNWIEAIDPASADSAGPDDPDTDPIPPRP